MRVFKDPFVQFITLGALIFLVYTWSQSGEQANTDEHISIDGPTQDWLYSNFKKQFRRVPTRDEMDALIYAYTEHEVKYREALAMGLDDRDSIVRRRMMQKFDFLFGNAAAAIVPEDGELQRWYELNSPSFALPPAISFTHIWFSPDSRGNAVAQAAEAALALLQAGESPQGDPFPFDVEFDRATPAEVRSVLGVEFADSILELSSDEWSGPILSGLGYHLVYVTDKTEGKIPPLDDIRASVLQQWRESESERILVESLATLKAGYTVEIDEDSLAQFDYAPDAVGHAP